MSRTPTALFESWRGRYADSPRAISSQLSARYPDLKQVWVTTPGTELPPGLHAVRRHSPQHIVHLTTSDFVVSNDIVTRYPFKKPSTRYLQTWHGTPLKRIGHDETMPAYDHASHMRKVDRDVKRWSALISTSVECTDLFRSAFRFEGTVLESGLPRNDVLLSSEAEQIRHRTRTTLGIDDSRFVVLWAPTWRDNVTDAAGNFTAPGGLDVDRFVDQTPDDVVLLVRMHSVVTVDSSSSTGSRVIDVSDHPDISDLYLASDALVSDYSSAVFDYAVLDQPILLLAHDLEEYSGEVRGLYFDYEDWAPGPVTEDTEGLIEELTRLIAHGRTALEKSRLADFRDRFCPHEDGSATKRVIDAFFSPQLDR